MPSCPLPLQERCESGRINHRLNLRKRLQLHGSRSSRIDHWLGTRHSKMRGGRGGVRENPLETPFRSQHQYGSQKPLLRRSSLALVILSRLYFRDVRCTPKGRCLCIPLQIATCTGSISCIPERPQHIGKAAIHSREDVEHQHWTQRYVVPWCIVTYSCCCTACVALATSQISLFVRVLMHRSDPLNDSM